MASEWKYTENIALALFSKPSGPERVMHRRIVRASIDPSSQSSPHMLIAGIRLAALS